VGSTSARRRRVGSGKYDNSWGRDSGSSTDVDGVDNENNVPPARGTRTYCACAPCRAGEPKTSEETQRAVKPSLQYLRGRARLSVCMRRGVTNYAYWHSPQETVKGEMTLSPILRDAYRAGRDGGDPE
jgi:hypothetical protein